MGCLLLPWDFVMLDLIGPAWDGGLRAPGSRCEYLAVLLIGQGLGRLCGQSRIGQDSGSRPPFSRNSMQRGMYVEIDDVASGVDDVTDEFLTLANRKMADPREDHR